MNNELIVELIKELQAAKKKQPLHNKFWTESECKIAQTAWNLGIDCAIAVLMKRRDEKFYVGT